MRRWSARAMARTTGLSHATTYRGRPSARPLVRGRPCAKKLPTRNGSGQRRHCQQSRCVRDSTEGSYIATPGRRGRFESAREKSWFAWRRASALPDRFAGAPPGGGRLCRQLPPRVARLNEDRPTGGECRRFRLTPDISMRFTTPSPNSRFSRSVISGRDLLELASPVLVGRARRNHAAAAGPTTMKATHLRVSQNLPPL